MNQGSHIDELQDQAKLSKASHGPEGTTSPQGQGESTSPSREQLILRWNSLNETLLNNYDSLAGALFNFRDHVHDRAVTDKPTTETVGLVLSGDNCVRDFENTLRIADDLKAKSGSHPEQKWHERYTRTRGKIWSCVDDWDEDTRQFRTAWSTELCKRIDRSLKLFAQLTKLEDELKELKSENEEEHDSVKDKVRSAKSALENSQKVVEGNSSLIDQVIRITEPDNDSMKKLRETYEKWQQTFSSGKKSH